MLPKIAQMKIEMAARRGQLIALWPWQETRLKLMRRGMASVNRLAPERPPQLCLESPPGSEELNATLRSSTASDRQGT